MLTKGKTEKGETEQVVIKVMTVGLTRKSVKEPAPEASCDTDDNDHKLLKPACLKLIVPVYSVFFTCEVLYVYLYVGVCMFETVTGNWM